MSTQHIPPAPRKFRPVRLGIDVGTYGTGYAWTIITPDSPSGGQREITKRRNWPGAPQDAVKTLTRLLLDTEGEVVAFGYDAQHKGDLRNAGGKDSGLRLVESIKMLLGRSPDKAVDATVTMGQHTDLPERYLALFLKQVYRLALTDIARAGYGEDQIQVCITVPAVFTDHQKQLVREAAYAAGVSQDKGALVLALEPEAAAQYALTSGVRIGTGIDAVPVDLTTPGTRFVVVDCGGGTIDITAYRRDSDGMTEIGKVRGAWRGSVYLNIAFENLILKPRFGGDRAYAKLLDRCPAAIRSMRDAWEQAKRHITVDHDDPLYLQIPAEIAQHLSPRTKKNLKDQQDGQATQLIITAEQIHAVFAEVIPQIIELVEQQLAFVVDEFGPLEQPENILLVGGFADSEYLRQSLADHFTGRATILTPPDPGGAVVAGAAHFACEPDTRARRVRYSYGIRVTEDFDINAGHRDEHKIVVDGKLKCRNVFSSHAHAGDIVPTTKTVSRRYFPLYDDQTGIKFDVYRSTSRTPTFVTDPSCDYVGSLEVSLKEVMKRDIDRRGVEVRFRFGETEIDVWAYVIETGKPVHVELDFVKLEALAV
ncbi:Hsp70 family protein [Amycolatopsis sp. OK19-0408]|uniref:Hsp70 family protein n=1 Tax=Amycolatopsis iheyensis TaxID=2945988 RepID=A0A9X2NG86_9PSEU|nr:Hsp70 family protein [Amycolatopsis iheyensis]MCR6488251.1 Hsp70 family protein [Amycolatopsis iheyensis]